MHSLRFVLSGAAALALMAGAYQPLVAKKPEATLTFTRLWTYGPTTPGQVSEIPAFDPRTNTIWVVGIVGVDVIDADSGTFVAHIDVTPHGAVNSVAIHNGFEPEYIAINHADTLAFVTLQEANGVAVLDLASSQFIEVIGLGAKDFSLKGNEIDPIDNDNKGEFQTVAAKGLYSIRSHERRNRL